MGHLRVGHAGGNRPRPSSRGARGALGIGLGVRPNCARDGYLGPAHHSSGTRWKASAIQAYGGSERLSLWGRIAAGVGAVGWWGAAVAAWAYSRDPAAALFCVVAGGLFAALGLSQVREASRQRAATRLLEDQLRSVDSGRQPPLGPGPASGGAV